MQVYEQVEKLFVGAPDLLDEFKLFLPENGGGGLFGSLAQQGIAAQSQMINEKAAKRASGGKETNKKKRGATTADGKPSKVSILAYLCVWFCGLILFLAIFESRRRQG